MARKIKENGNNGQRTTGQANIFVFLGTIRVAHTKDPSIISVWIDTFHQSFASFLKISFLAVRRVFRNFFFSSVLDVIFTSLRKFM